MFTWNVRLKTSASYAVHGNKISGKYNFWINKTKSEERKLRTINLSNPQYLMILGSISIFKIPSAKLVQH